MRIFSCRALAFVAFAAVVVTSAFASPARADVINAFLLELTNNEFDANSIGVDIKIQDITGGVQFSATLREIPGLDPASGDIFALWFDVAPSVNLANVNPSSPYEPSDLMITGFVKGHDSIGSAPWGANPNINGMPNPFSAGAGSRYDVAMRFGGNGAANGYYPHISFKLTNITTADFLASRFAARVMSIGDNDESGKYAGLIEQPPVIPTPSAALGGLALAGMGILRRRRA